MATPLPLYLLKATGAPFTAPLLPSKRTDAGESRHSGVGWLAGEAGIPRRRPRARPIALLVRNRLVDTIPPMVGWCRRRVRWRGACPWAEGCRSGFSPAAQSAPIVGTWVPVRPCGVASGSNAVLPPSIGVLRAVLGDRPALSVSAGEGSSFFR